MDKQANDADGKKRQDFQFSREADPCGEQKVDAKVIIQKYRHGKTRGAYQKIMKAKGFGENNKNGEVDNSTDAADYRIFKNIHFVSYFGGNLLLLDEKLLIQFALMPVSTH